MFRSSAKLFEQANDLFTQGNFPAAEGKYADAQMKFQKDGDPQSAQLAGAYAVFVALSHAGMNATAYAAVAVALKNLGGATLKLGVREVPAPSLATEVAIVSEDIAALGLPRDTPAQQAARAQALKQAGVHYQSAIGQNIVFVTELFQKETITGMARAFALFALSEEMQGDAAAYTDPKAAGAHYQQASIFWTQAKNSDAALSARTRGQELQKAVKCWFCGREVTGLAINFFELPSELTVALTKSESASVLPTFDVGSNKIYSCRGCNSTMNTLADGWALKRSAEVYVKLEAEIEQLRKQIQQRR